MGLSPDSPEDESGIKKAAENSECHFLFLQRTFMTGSNCFFQLFFKRQQCVADGFLVTLMYNTVFSAVILI